MSIATSHAIDRDGDGLIYDGTKYERPAASVVPGVYVNPDYDPEPYKSGRYQKTDDGRTIHDLSLSEYIQEINPGGKWHEEDFMDRHRSDAQKEELSPDSDWWSKEKYPVLVYVRNGIEYRRGKEATKYVKLDEEGDIVRDEKGLATYMTEEEKRSKGYAKYRSTIAAFKGSGAVGYLGDSFGAVELYVTQNHRGEGIGTELSYIFRSENPFKESGGFSTGGQRAAEKAYWRIVHGADGAPKKVRDIEGQLEAYRKQVHDYYEEHVAVIPNNNAGDFAKRNQAWDDMREWEIENIKPHMDRLKAEVERLRSLKPEELRQELGEQPTLKKPHPSNLEYADWFRGSVMVNSSGEPLTLYHGTDVEFGSVDPSVGSEYGFYMTPNLKYAMSYGSNIKKYQASIKNPLIVEGKYEVSPKDLTRDDIDRLISQGYDGIVVIGFDDPENKIGMRPLEKADEVVAFFPWQVREVKSLGPVSEAEPIEDSSKHVTDTPEFKAWFGKSQVVDESGKPLVVYHGTNRSFTEFDEGRQRTARNDKYQGDGFYFVDDPEIAGRYAGAAANQSFDRETIEREIHEKHPGIVADLFTAIVDRGYYQAWEDIKDKYDLHDKPYYEWPVPGDIDLNTIGDLAKVTEGSNYEKGREPREPGVQDVFDAMFGGYETVSEYDLKSAAELGLTIPAETVIPVYLKAENILRTGNPEEARTARERGYDGVYYYGPETVEDHPEWIVFEPTQIKSALGNTGDFDPANPDITKAFKESEHPRDDNGRFIDKASIAEASRNPPMVAGLLRRTSNPEQRDLLIEQLRQAGLTDDTLERAVSFGRWFGDSKIVDEDGNPRVVYHGTPSPGFSTFDHRPEQNSSHPDSHLGIFFTDTPSEASGYSRMDEYVDPDVGGPDYHRGMPSSVYPVYLRIENPAVVPYDHISIEGVGSLKVDPHREQVSFAREIRDYYENELGHDGIVFATSDGTTNYIVFDPRNIKSATANEGGYSPDSSDITKAFKESDHPRGKDGKFIGKNKIIEAAKSGDKAQLEALLQDVRPGDLGKLESALQKEGASLKDIKQAEASAAKNDGGQQPGSASESSQPGGESKGEAKEEKPAPSVPEGFESSEEYKSLRADVEYQAWSDTVQQLESILGKDITELMDKMPSGDFAQQTDWMRSKIEKELGKNKKLDWEPKDDFSSKELEKKASKTKESAESSVRRREWSEARDRNRKMFRDSLAKSGLPPETKQKYLSNMQDALKRMPLKAQNTVSLNVWDTNWYADTDSLSKAAAPVLGIKLADGEHISGMYVGGVENSPESGVMHLDGGDDAVGTYLHEMAHSFDWDADNNQKISATQEWKDAWSSEIKNGFLSRYARTNEVEGFAEFARLAYKHGPKIVSEKFPKSTEIFKKHGYL